MRLRLSLCGLFLPCALRLFSLAALACPMEKTTEGEDSVSGMNVAVLAVLRGPFLNMVTVIFAFGCWRYRGMSAVGQFVCDWYFAFVLRPLVLLTSIVVFCNTDEATVWITLSYVYCRPRCTF